MRAPQLAAIVAVAILVVVGVVVLVGIGPAGDTADAPSPSPAATESAAPSASPAATASPDPSQLAGEEEILEAVLEIEQQVRTIRGLEAPDIGPPDLITRAELADELQQMFDEEYPPDEREQDNRALRALGLLGPDEDIVELQLELLGDQVLGFYDPSEDRMVVVTDAGFDAAARLTYAHEYAHALQDAAFDPANFNVDAEIDDDEALALTTVTEGDATLTMLVWAFQNLSQEELVEIGTTTEIPDTSGIPSWMVNQLQFPYTAGQVWASELAGNPLAPDFGPIDAAYANPPESTEQVIDLEAWETREPPIEVEVPDLADALGDGWETVDETTLGQATIGIMLEYFGVDDELALGAADGWGGDRVVIASGPDDAFGVAWRLAWDTPQDAAQFVEAYEQVVPTLPFPALVREVDDDEVLVVHASSTQVLEQVVAAAD